MRRCWCPSAEGALMVQTAAKPLRALQSAARSDLLALPDGASGVLRDTRSLFQGGQTKTCQASGTTVRRSASSLAPLLCLITAGNHNNMSARYKEENESLSRA